MKLFVLDHNQVLAEVKKNFEIVTNIEESDRVVLWNDVNPLERGIIKLAHSRGQKVIVMQHGRKGSSKYYPPFNEKIQADKYLAWGDFDRRRLVEAGNDARRIEVVGTTVLSGLPKRRDHGGINIVFCPEHWDREVEENLRTRDELRKLRGVKVITKLIEAHSAVDYDNPVISRRSEPEHLSICGEVLALADLVVGISESTFELMSQAMGIPVVIMEEWEPKAFGGDIRYLTYQRLISSASKKARLENLRDVIGQQLASPDELCEERKRVIIDEGGINLNAREEIIRAIREE